MEFYGVRLLVKDFDKCFKFYTEDMGLTAIWGSIGGDYATISIGNVPALALFKSDLMAPSLGNIDLPMPDNCREKSMICIKVEDVDKTYDEMMAKGLELVNKPTDMPGWGMRMVHLRDPEGNVIELSSELSMDKWDQELIDENKKYE